MTEISFSLDEAALAERLLDPLAHRLLEGLTAISRARERTDGKLALTKQEAAAALGMSIDHLDRHVMPDLRVVRSGRLRLIPVAELERWLERNAARVLEAER